MITNDFPRTYGLAGYEYWQLLAMLERHGNKQILYVLEQMQRKVL